MNISANRHPVTARAIPRRVDPYTLVEARCAPCAIDDGAVILRADERTDDDGLRGFAEGYLHGSEYAVRELDDGALVAERLVVRS